MHERLGSRESWPLRLLPGSVARMLDLCDLTRRHDDRECWRAWPAVMSRLVPAPLLSTCICDRSSKHCHRYWNITSQSPICPQPRPRAQRHRPNTLSVLSPRDPREQPSNPFFDTLHYSCTTIRLLGPIRHPDISINHHLNL